MADVFLDLDGTLTDPFPGITASINHALEQEGLPTVPRDELRWAIGPALKDSLARLGFADPERGVKLYRDYYAEHGIFDCALFEGIPEVLEQLQADGHRLFLMTAKARVFAERITEHFGLSQYLTAQFGPELDGTRNDKAELLAWALPQTGTDPGRAVMVGDRLHDIHAGRENGIATVAVMWGYGTEDEWAQADFRCEEVKHLSGLIDLIYDDG